MGVEVGVGASRLCLPLRLRRTTAALTELYYPRRRTFNVSAALWTQGQAANRIRARNAHPAPTTQIPSQPLHGPWPLSKREDDRHEEGDVDNQRPPANTPDKVQRAIHLLTMARWRNDCERPCAIRRCGSRENDPAKRQTHPNFVELRVGWPVAMCVITMHAPRWRLSAIDMNARNPLNRCNDRAEKSMHACVCDASRRINICVDNPDTPGLMFDPRRPCESWLAYVVLTTPRILYKAAPESSRRCA